MSFEKIDPTNPQKISRREFLKKSLIAGALLTAEALIPEKLIAGNKQLNKYLSQNNIEKMPAESLEDIREELYKKSLTEENEQRAIIVKEKGSYKKISDEKMEESSPVSFASDPRLINALWGEDIGKFEEFHDTHTHNEKARLDIYHENDWKYPNRKTTIPPSTTDFMNWTRNIFFALSTNKIGVENFDKLPGRWGVEEPGASWRIKPALDPKESPENQGMVKMLIEMNDSLERISGYSDRMIDLYIERMDDTEIPKITGVNMTKEQLKTKDRTEKNLIIWLYYQASLGTSFLDMTNSLESATKKIMENPNPGKDDELIKKFQETASKWGFQIDCVKR